MCCIPISVSLVSPCGRSTRGICGWRNLTDKGGIFQERRSGLGTALAGSDAVKWSFGIDFETGSGAALGDSQSLVLAPDWSGTIMAEVSGRFMIQKPALTSDAQAI